MRKFFWGVMVLFLLSVKAGYSYQNVIPELGYSDSILEEGTTAAFTIAVTSAGATAATFTVYTTSAKIIVSQLPGAATTWFTGLQTSTYTLAEFVNNINNTTGSGTLVATFSDGCYKLQVSSPQIATANTTDGLLTEAGGTTYNILLSSITSVWAYLNSTCYLSIYKAALNGTWAMFQLNTSSITSIMSCYEGVTSTITSTLKSIPITGLLEKNYPDFAPLKFTNDYAAEYRVQFSTWISVNDKISVHSIKR